AALGADVLFRRLLPEIEDPRNGVEREEQRNDEGDGFSHGDWTQSTAAACTALSLGGSLLSLGRGRRQARLHFPLRPGAVLVGDHALDRRAGGGLARRERA